MTLTDESPMPFGKYEGTPMEDVPASYLIYLKDNDLQRGPVLRYILNNLETLQAQEAYKNRNK